MYGSILAALVGATSAMRHLYIYPNDTLSLPLSDFMTPDGSSYESSEKAVAVINGWKLAGDRQADLQHLHEVYQVISASSEVMGFIFDNNQLSYVSLVDRPKKKQTIQGVITFKGAKEAKCYDAAFHEGSWRLFYACASTESGKTNVTLYLIDPSSGDLIEALRLPFPTEFNLGTGLQSKILNGTLFIYGTTSSDPVYVTCINIGSAKLKDITCKQKIVDSLASISSLEEAPEKEGILLTGKAKDSEKKVLIKCLDTCHIMASLVADDATAVFHGYRHQLIVRTGKELKVCEVFRYGESLVCRKSVSVDIDQDFVIRSAVHSDHDKIALLFSKPDSGEYLRCGNLNSITGRHLLGNPNTFGAAFNDSYYFFDPQQTGLVFRQLDIEPTVVIDASKIKESAVVVASIAPTGDPSRAVQLKVEKLTTMNPEPAFPATSTPFKLANPKLCIMPSTFTGQNLKFEFSKGEIIDDSLEIHGVSGEILAAGDDWIIARDQKLAIYECAVQRSIEKPEGRLVFACSPAVSSTSADLKVPSSMKLVQSQRLDGRGYFLAFADEKQSEILVVLDGFVGKQVIKGVLKEVRGVAALENRLDRSKLYFATMTTTAVSLYLFDPSTQKFSVVSSPEVECPVSIELSSKQLRVAEGCDNNQVKYYNYPFKNLSPDLVTHLPADITVAGFCVFENHILVAHSPGLLDHSSPASSELRMYPRALLGKVSTPAPQHLPVPNPSPPIRSLSCVPDTKGSVSILATTSMNHMAFAMGQTTRYISDLSLSNSRVTRSGRFVTWDKTSVRYLTKNMQLCVNLGEVGTGEEPIKLNVSDSQGRFVTGSLIVKWEDEKTEIKMKKIGHEFMKLGPHDIDNLIDINGVVFNATFVGEDKDAARVIPSIEFLQVNNQSTGSEKKVYSDLYMSGNYTFGIHSQVSAGLLSSKLDAYLDQKLKYTITLPISAKVGSVKAYPRGDRELIVFVDGLDYSRSGNSAFFRLYYKDVTVEPIEPPKADYIDSPEGYSGLELDDRFLYLISTAPARILPVGIETMETTQELSILSADLSIVSMKDHKVVVSCAVSEIEAFILNSEGEEVKRQRYKQENSINLSKPKCGKVNEDAISCVFVSTGAFIVEWKLNLSSMEAKSHYHQVVTGYEALAVYIGGDYLIAHVQHITGKAVPDEIHIWKLGAIGGHGKVAYTFNISNSASTKTRYSIAVRKQKLENKTPALLAIANPSDSLSLAFLKIDHLKIHIVKSEFDKKQAILQLNGLSVAKLTLEYLQQKEDDKPSPERKGELSTFVWTLMVCLIVMSLVGIMLLLLYSINNHRATLYDKSVDDSSSSYSKVEDTIQQNKTNEHLPA